MLDWSSVRLSKTLIIDMTQRRLSLSPMRILMHVMALLGVYRDMMISPAAHYCHERLRRRTYSAFINRTDARDRRGLPLRHDAHMRAVLPRNNTRRARQTSRLLPHYYT